jgi:hypothetical protein
MNRKRESYTIRFHGHGFSPSPLGTEGGKTAKLVGRILKDAGYEVTILKTITSTTENWQYVSPMKGRKVRR